MLLEVVDKVEFLSAEVSSGISEGKYVWWLDIFLVSENPVSVISKDEVLWELEINEYFDGDISVTSIVLEVFPIEMII